MPWQIGLLRVRDLTPFGVVRLDMLPAHAVPATPMQLYASRSTVRDTTIEELSDNKYQVTAGIQTRRRRNVLRFAVTENLANFSNTPDVGVTLSYARVVPGRR